MDQVEIRPARPEDLAALTAALGDEEFFTDRLDRQRRERGVLLTAWVAGSPIGAVYLWLESADEPEVREHLPGVPLLNQLEVRAEYRNRGVGTKLTGGATGNAATPETSPTVRSSRRRVIWWNGTCTSWTWMSPEPSRSPGAYCMTNLGRVS